MAQADLDAIVAGAGAGGAAAAYHLSRAGLRVLVVDKARLPRYKACGGAIPQPTLGRLPIALDGVVRARPAAVRFTFPGLPPVDRPLPDQPVAMVLRSEFDALLLGQSGAEVLDGTAVTGVEEAVDHVRVRLVDHTLTARYLVGADGAASSIARWLGLRCGRTLGGTLEAEVPIDGRRDLGSEYGNRAVFMLGAVPWGYAWIFPKGDSLSVGIGRFRPGRLDLRAALRQAVEPLGIDLEGVRLHGHPIPSYRPRHWPLWGAGFQERLVTRRCVLVGDAAGLVDPLIGEGIRYALVSGRLAAEAIAADDLSGYGRAVWERIGHNLATAAMTAELFYRWPRRCYLEGVRNPATVRHFVDLLTEKANYTGIGRRVIWSTLKWTLRSNHGGTEAQRTVRE